MAKHFTFCILRTTNIIPSFYILIQISILKIIPTYKAINLARRLILTKAVLQEILAYMMSVFPAPKGILQKIRSIKRDFLWRGVENKTKWALVPWEKVCRPKVKRGMGLQDP
jgi:hypothetical protein